MNLFQEFIFIYFVSTTALAGFTILWRNWLNDHPSWKTWLHDHAGFMAKALTCGSCFTFWITLLLVIAFNPLGEIFTAVVPFSRTWPPILYFIQWMSLGWGTLFLRFSYVAIQETVSTMVHSFTH